MTAGINQYLHANGSAKSLFSKLTVRKVTFFQAPVPFLIPSFPADECIVSVSLSFPFLHKVSLCPGISC